MNLYNLSNQYQLLLENIHDADGVINEEALKSLEEHHDLMNNKCIAISSYIKNLAAEAEAVKNAEHAMYDRRKALERKHDHLLEYLKTNMDRCGISEIKCPQFVIKVKKNPLSVNIYNDDIIPDKYIITIVDTKIDKRLIKEDLQANIHVPGAMLQQQTRVDIK